ncbi:MAG: hypothetical protein J5605_02955, partial [Bacteroidales bacterium]|nr:hypothetical protein [Bacteroidales bacterium]
KKADKANMAAARNRVVLFILLLVLYSHEFICILLCRGFIKNQPANIRFFLILCKIKSFFANKSLSRLADFRLQKGIYVIFRIFVFFNFKVGTIFQLSVYSRCFRVVIAKRTGEKTPSPHFQKKSYLCKLL